MEDAKVVINLKEGIIDVQGPADFVRHCLEMYGPSIRGLLSLPQDTAATPEKAGGAPQKRKAAAVTRPRRKKRTSGIGTIQSDLEAGFFDEPRSTDEIKGRLSDAGVTITDGGVRANLRKLMLDGLLDTVRTGRLVRYHRRGRS